MKLMFLGADHEVTGSCTVIEVGGRYGLVDCGMEQGTDMFVNEPLPMAPSALDFVLLTHAHVDHSGNIPLLFKNGYDGPVYATGASCQLCEIMLRDCAHIQESEAEWHSRKARRAGQAAVEPAYSMEDAEAAVSHLRPCEYDRLIQVGEGVVVRFTDAGHLLGSASIEVFLTEGEVTKKVVFSGDIGNLDQPIIRNPVYIEEADYVLTEATYGDRLHERGGPNSLRYLADCLQRTFDRGGNVVIPSFAVGRTQELLYFIRVIKERGLVTGHGDFPVYVDSPLANEATGIFLQCGEEYFDDETRSLLARGVNPLMSPGVQLAVSSEESKQINFDRTPKVILSASGMCEAGRIRHHLKHNLWRKECTILFVGYQAAGTTGRRILDGAKDLQLFGETISVKAEIAFLPGKSGHADRDGLLRWISAFREKPAHVFVNHGEDASVSSYAALLRDNYGLQASAPYSGAIFDLLAGEYVVFPEGVPVVRVKAGAARAAEAFAALVAACERLMEVVRGCRGIPNKELSKFTGQINSLADKWSSWSRRG